MDQSDKYSLLHYLNTSKKGLLHIQSNGTKLTKDINVHLQHVIDGVEASLRSPGTFDKVAETESTDELGEQGDPTTETSHEEQLDQAFEILKDESKPGPTFLSRQMEIKISQARNLCNELFKTGRLIKGQRFTDSDAPTDPAPETETKKSTGKGKSANPKVMELVEGLPVGSDTLLPPHLRRLIALPEAHRAPYLSGLKLEDIVTPDDIARAAVNGIDMTLVDEVNALTRSRKLKAKPEDIIVCKREGSEREQKYFRIRARCVNSIRDGRALYDHMSSGGLTKRVLSDMLEIAKASKHKQV